MNLSAFLYSIASVPMFSSRPFLAAFVTALLARFGTSLPFLSDNAMIQALHRAPEWFTGWPSLLILGVLAVAEVLAVKHSEVRAILDEFDGIVKSVVAALVALALLDKETAATIHSIQKAGLGFHSLGSILVGGLVWVVSGLRRGVVGILAEIDDHDDIGLQSLLNWVENSWTVLGILFLVIAPIVALILSALTALGLWLFRKAAERAEHRSRIPCAKCGALVLPHASACATCRTPLAAPRAVGVFGQPKAKPAVDPARQGFELISRKRCPVCATRLTARAVQQPCPTCRTVTFASPEEFERYLAVLASRLPRTMFVCFCLGLIPILGVIPGVIYFRLNLVAGLRGYIPPLRGCLTRVLVRFIGWGLIALQPIPLLGGVVLAFMCWSTYAIYRSSLRGRAHSDFAKIAAAPAAA